MKKKDRIGFGAIASVVLGPIGGIITAIVSYYLIGEEESGDRNRSYKSYRSKNAPISYHSSHTSWKVEETVNRVERLLDYKTSSILLPKFEREERSSKSSFLDEYLNLTKPKIDLNKLLEEDRKFNELLSRLRAPSVSTSPYVKSKTSTIRSTISDLTFERKSRSGSPTIDEAIQRIIQAESD